MTACAQRAEGRPGHRAQVSSLFQCQARGNQGATFDPRFNQYRQFRQPADESIALGELIRPRFHPRRILGHQQPARPENGLGQSTILFWVQVAKTRAQHRDGFATGYRQRATMRRSINTYRQTADHCTTTHRQSSGHAMGQPATCIGALAGTNQGNTALLQHRQIAEAKENQWGIWDMFEQIRVRRVVQTDRKEIKGSQVTRKSLALDKDRQRRTAPVPVIGFAGKLQQCVRRRSLR